jgi:hypothetical protein
MYPTGALADLAARKRILQARIAVRRLECVEAAMVLSQPVATLDRGLAMWRKIAPFAKLLAIPGGIFLARSFQRRRAAGRTAKRGKIAALFAALPLIMRGAKIVMQFRAAHAAQKAAAHYR